MQKKQTPARSLTVAEFLALRKFNLECSSVRMNFMLGKKGLFMLREMALNNLSPPQRFQFCKALDKLYSQVNIEISSEKSTGCQYTDKILSYFLKLSGVGGADVDLLIEPEELIFQTYSHQRILREKSLQSEKADRPIYDQEMRTALPTKVERQAEEIVYKKEQIAAKQKVKRNNVKKPGKKAMRLMRKAESLLTIYNEGY